MKVVFVSPRYGTEIVGGAEHAARMLAENLAVATDWEVSAYSSCALASDTWANAYAPGVVEINGVSVHRFPVTGPRSPQFLQTSEAVHRNVSVAPLVLQEQWIDEQGPLVPDLLEALRMCDADIAVFYPYLYYPTVRGMFAVAPQAKVVMHPAAHDETPIRMPIFRDVFDRADGLVFQTGGEQQLVESLFPVAGTAQLQLGLGIEPQTGDEAGFRAAFGLGNAPYVLCLGRVDAGKGSHLLVRFFEAWKASLSADSPLRETRLVLVGPIVDESLGKAHGEGVLLTGPLSDALKWGAISGASVLVNPSPFEAFSLVLLEAWSCGVPVMVNARCIATREHVERSGGGFIFDGYASFVVGLERLLGDADVASGLGAAGASYVSQNYLWPRLIARYRAWLERLVG